LAVCGRVLVDLFDVFLKHYDVFFYPGFFVHVVDVYGR
jgi:hypothetical protein